MKNLIKKVLREESQTINMMDFWDNSPKVTDVSDNEQMDKLMWHMIDYVDFPSDGNFRRINSFIESLIRYGLIDIEFYTEMYKWLNHIISHQ